MRAKHIYLTGAPAVGKSSLTRAIADITDTAIFEYGKEMSQHLSRTRTDASQQALRGGTAPHVTAADISTVNELMSTRAAAATDAGRNFITDAHQVTAEEFGLSCIPFTARELWRCDFNEIWLLHGSRSVVSRRMNKERDGRRALPPNMQQAHIDIQAQVAVTYSTMMGLPLIAMDADQPTGLMLEHALTRLRRKAL